MPLIECTLIKGYDSDVRQRLAERVTDAACSSIGAAADFVTVTISEVDSDNYMRGRTKRVPASAPRQAEDIVRNFLASLEARDLETAKSHLSENFTMTFPGDAKFAALEE
ncbi:MAG: tautomerase family protein, partial [Alphaproteobacteria bacterium]